MINSYLAEWLQQVGIADNYSTLIIRVLSLLFILLVCILIDAICRKAIIPAVKTLTNKTESTWDNHLLNDDVLRNFCRLVMPVIVYVLFPIVFPDGLWHDLVLKLCSIFITVMAMKLICSVISSLYAISSEHEKMKEHSLKGFKILVLLRCCS